ncbi:MAG: ISAzo13 family transposase, partial [Elusimicrobia bacterium]|nr:ISAzo13 family transposase [Elusimicrobiota bacterium]
MLFLLPYLNEKQKRIAAAVEARALGYGGVSEVSKITGLSRTTLHQAIKELKNPKTRREMEKARVRVSGGGRKKILAQHPSLLKKLKSLVEPATRGDPVSPLLWTSKSTRHLSEVLSKKGRPVGHQVVARALQEMNYSLQVNSKT